jgi:hypothetical protein
MSSNKTTIYSTPVRSRKEDCNGERSQPSTCENSQAARTAQHNAFPCLPSISTFSSTQIFSPHSRELHSCVRRRWELGVRVYP